MTYNLPKPHLSFSQIELWIKARETYRKKYYAKDPPQYAQSPEMAFGNEVTEAMERNEEWCAFIPRHKTFEHEMIFDIGGVKILAYIDNIDLETMTFREQKTGRTPWTQNKVNKHKQLDIYSLGLQEKYGKINDKCELVHVMTEKVLKTKMFQGIELESDSYDLKLTGEYTIFERIITQQERDDMKTLIIKVAREIEEDWVANKHLYE